MPKPVKKLADIEVSNIKDIQCCGRGHYQGTCSILGTFFHAIFVRVKATKDGLECTGDSVAKDVFEDFQQLDEESFQTITLPGEKGKWVLVIQPFCK